MRGLTDDEAALIAAPSGAEFPDKFTAIADQLVAQRRMKKTGQVAGGPGLYRETKLGLLALQLWKAGIK